MSPDEKTIAIMGQHVPASREQIDISKLRFLPDNPRVYAAIREMTDFDALTPQEKQVRIYERLLKEPSVTKLIPEIQRDGGLQDPITVRWDTQEVVEGNSRLAAYRKLNDDDPAEERWKLIACLVVSSLTDEQQTRLLGQAHLLGKTEWSPYAKALFCYRWIRELKRDVSTLAGLTSFTPLEINKNVSVIELMRDNEDRKLSNFSYYNVLVRTRTISTAIKERKSLRDTVLAQIKTGEFTAQEMRDRLPTIIAKERILRKYEKGDVSLDDAFDRAKISDVEHRLKKIRDGLDDVERDDLKALERNQFKAVQQVVRKIRQHLKRVSDMVDAELARKR